MGVWGLTVQRPGRRGVGVRQPHSALAGAGVPPRVRARENLQKQQGGLASGDPKCAEPGSRDRLQLGDPA